MCFIRRAHLVVQLYLQKKSVDLFPHYPHLYTKLKFRLAVPFHLGQLVVPPLVLEMIGCTRICRWMQQEAWRSNFSYFMKRKFWRSVFLHHL